MREAELNDEWRSRVPWGSGERVGSSLKADIRLSVSGDGAGDEQDCLKKAGQKFKKGGISYRLRRWRGPMMHPRKVEVRGVSLPLSLLNGVPGL